jgi:hypothetical protein
MTEEEIKAARVDELKARLGEQAEAITDEQFLAVLADAEAVLKAQRIDVDQNTGLLYRIATVYINQRGSEGIASESYEGISQTNLTDLPDDIRRDIHTLRGVIW